MRLTFAWGLRRACGLVAATCLIAVVVISGVCAWAQGGDAPQSQEQLSNPSQNNPSQSSPPQNNPPQTSGQTQGKELPDAPDESKKKDENANPNPVQAVADKTKDVATAGLKKARDW